MECEDVLGNLQRRGQGFEPVRVFGCHCVAGEAVRQAHFVRGIREDLTLMIAPDGWQIQGDESIRRLFRLEYAR
ncbi:hypothetical protein ABIB26_001466 [Arthrobacter sp. UYEF20]